MNLTRKASKIIGNIKNVNLVFLNHQDPDVGYNAGYLQKMNPSMYVLCSEDTWRLVNFYGLNPKKYRPAEHFKDMKASLQTGHIVSFVPTPFCHFRGALMIYDHENRILFTGDLFGGLSYVQDLYADERYWEGLKTFHQIYMPTQEAIKLAIANIRALDPPPLMIAPQHGSIIEGKWLDYYIDKLERLPVGLNLLIESQQKDNYIAALNELLLEFSRFMGMQAVSTAMRLFQDDGSFPNVIRADGKGVREIRVDPQTAVDLLVEQFIKQFPDQSSMIEVAVVKVLLGRNIPLPETLVGGEGETPEFFEV
jgi:glyoxylase-like metal-dependent hydrolase (beta-lactamase superfamily II)